MVATANEVKALPYELYRKGRFSEIFYAGLPNEYERRDALLQYMQKSMKTTQDDKLLDQLVSITKGYSYSDIENAIKDVAQRQLISGQKVISAKELLAAVKHIIPISQTNPELISSIEKWGSERAINVSQQQEVMR